MPSDHPQTHDQTPYLHMLWASFAFTLMATFSRWAADYCDWRLIAFARASLACVFALLLAKAVRAKLVFWRPRILWVRSFAGSLSMFCNFYALAHLPVSDTLTLMNTTPIWVTLLSWLVFKQKPTPGVIIAVLTSVLGIVFIQQPHFQDGKFAILMALTGAVTTSIAMLGLSRLQAVDPRAIVVHFSAVASVSTLTLLLLTGPSDSFAPLGNMEVVSLLLLIGVGGVLGQIGMTMAFAKGHATRISVVALSQILFGLAVDLVLWKHQLNWLSLVGMVLVVAPTAWILLGETPKQSHDVVEAEMS
ncbi:MAG TPA: DMT family transporter [Blastocatellia bacterium]|nr:DMT family transporter [Blastocatellia bacterium]